MCSADAQLFQVGLDMAQVINTNIMSLNTQRSLGLSQDLMQLSLERLSTGLRINRAKDDAAGLALSETLTMQIKGLEQAVRNANDGISLLQTAEGALSEVNDALQRMRELATQASNGTYNSNDRASLHSEFDELRAEIIRISDVTEFNDMNLLGTTGSVSLQVGWENGANNRITIGRIDIATASYGAGGIANALSAINDISTQASASAVMSLMSTAIDKISLLRSDFGAIQNRLESAVRNMENVDENITAARSRILDSDFATETANFTKAQIIQQAGTAMLAQANLSPQNVFSLLN